MAHTDQLFCDLMKIVEAVPDGYQKDRRKITNWGEFKEEPRSPGDGIPTHHLPIVHVSHNAPFHTHSLSIALSTKKKKKYHWQL